ncbi:MAG: serine hydrolase [Acidobacteriota bacterium]|nr:serine hydrolase [Acidobacteriota bacterium]
MFNRLRIRTALIALAALCVAMPPSVAAQTETDVTRRIDEYVSAHAATSDFSGVVLLAKDGKLLFLKSYGLASREWQVPNAPDTKFRIGSITKPFTAMLVMQLHARGELQPGDSICRFLSPCPDAWQPVTIHHLLTHTSGIRSHTSIPAWQARNMAPHTADEVVGYIRDLPLRSAPGARHAYNNSGYFLLGLVIEKVTGRKYEEVLKERILAPLGMIDSGYDWPGTIIPRRASGYDGRGATLRNTPSIDMHSVFASGAMYSTALDLLKWDQALYGETLLPDALKSTMWTPALDNYAYGWEIAAPSPKTFGHARMSHSGGINGFGANLIRVPEARLTAIVLSNNEAAPATLISNDILSIYYGTSVTPPAARAVATVDPANYDRYAGQYRLPSGAVLTISREGDKLFAHAPGPGTFELTPESDTRFFSDTPETTITFTVDGNVVTQLVLNLGGRDRIARRVQ